MRKRSQNEALLRSRSISRPLAKAQGRFAIWLLPIFSLKTILQQLTSWAHRHSLIANALARSASADSGLTYSLRHPLMCASRQLLPASCTTCRIPCGRGCITARPKSSVLLKNNIWRIGVGKKLKKALGFQAHMSSVSMATSRNMFLIACQTNYLKAQTQ